MKEAPSEQRTIPRLLQAAAQAYGSRTAIEEPGRSLSFADLQAQAMRAARAFLAAGIEQGDRVALWAPNAADWVVAALGAQCAGGVLVPLNTRLKGREASYILRKSRARILCTVTEFLGTNYLDLLAGEELPALTHVVSFGPPDSRAIAWSDFLVEGERVAPETAEVRAAAVRPDDLSDILFTSGTTGAPKGVMTAHGQNLRAFESWSEIVGLCESDRYLVVNPFFHSFGYKAGWLSCLMRGATCLPHAVFDVSVVLDRIARERVTVLPGPPTLYQSILAHPDRERFDLSSLRLAVTGAASIPVQLIHRMRDELGFRTVITGYGLTEACGIATMCRQDDDPETIATTSGRAIPDVEVRCVDTSGREVPRGEPGEVTVRGYNVMKGYFDDPDATREAIDAEGWLHTGDIGVMDERGYLRITDRLKDMYICGGFNCYPAEIENMLYRHPGVGQVAVIGVPDERLGEVGMAFVVPRPGYRLEEDELIAWCRANMANYKVPRRVRLVDSLPLNASGKVMKFVLRQWAEQGLDS